VPGEFDLRILVTGGAGLVGIECCRFFSRVGCEVVAVDNFTRGKLFGREADTRANVKLLEELGVRHHNLDFRDRRVCEIIRECDAIVHAAAQPSHPKSVEIPREDFEINASGTLQLLEMTREVNKQAVFVHCSTNKVYGDVPNYFCYTKVDKRFEPVDPGLMDGFDESLRIDRCMHTPFGVSKLCGDIYAQEYAYLYGMKTGVFRMGCITGGAAMAAEQHNWEPFFVRKALSGELLTIYGYDGYQVRDVIHAGDLAELFYQFIKSPRPGQTYNVGGARQNSTSLLEAIDLIEEITGKKMVYQFGPCREGDHIWWITNIHKVMQHFPAWRIRRNLRQVFDEIYDRQIEILGGNPVIHDIKN